MKLLLLFAHEYWLKPHHQNPALSIDVLQPLPGELPHLLPQSLRAASVVVALVHVEPSDTAQRGKLITKAVKQIKWLAGKFTTREVVLHSFAHLASTSADPNTARAMIEEMRQRLVGADYRVQTSPFGYFNEFMIHVGGPSLAKVFVDL